MYTTLSRVFESTNGEFNPHNNILPMVPQLWQVLDDPAVRRNVTAILGDNYFVHVHRHPHISHGQPGKKTPAMLQPLHKDGHAVKPRPRHREPWWLIMFYYPQEVTLNNGPTGLLPGTHLLPRLGGKEDWYHPPKLTKENDQLLLPDDGYVQRNVQPMICAAGSAALAHFDIGHGAMMNGTDQNRFACKFVFMRTERPPKSGAGTIQTDNPVSRHLCQWLGYETSANDVSTFADWQRALNGDDPRARVEAIYMSASVDNQASVRDALLHDIHQHLPGEDSNWVLEYADASNGLALLGDLEPIQDLLNQDSDGLLINGCFAAGQTGNQAFAPRLTEIVRNKNPFIQRHAMSALGLLGPGAHQSQTIETLDEIIRTSDDWDLKLYAIQSLIRQGAIKETIPSLAIAARDPHTYVNAFAIEQLCRIDDDEARRAVLEPLRRHRWMEDPRYDQKKSL